MEDLIFTIVFVVVAFFTFKIVISAISSMIKFFISIIVIVVFIYTYNNYEEVKNFVFSKSKNINIEEIKNKVKENTTAIKNNITNQALDSLKQ